MGLLRFVLIGAIFSTIHAQDRTGTLTGVVTDITGTGISGAYAQLRTAAGNPFRARADSNGIYKLSGLPPDEYTLKLEGPGFKSLTVKAIKIAEGERKSLAPLPLEVGYDCGSGRVALDYFRLFPPEDNMGSLRGSVKIENGRNYEKRPPAPGANIMLIGDGGKILAESATDLKGEFLFKNLPSGDFSIRVKRAGFYTVEEAGFAIREGFESTYWPISIEHCPRGNCDPALRTKRIIICE